MTPRSEDRPQVVLFLDESGTSDSLTLVGATAFYDVAAAEAAIKQARDRALGDASLWVNQSKRERFASTGFHFADDNEAVRQQLLAALRSIEFRAYAAYATNDGTRPTTDLLVGMYGTLLRSVLARYRDYELAVVFEQNNEMDPLYGRLWSALRGMGAVPPQAKSFRGTKTAPCLAATDYVLGVTRKHLSDTARDFERGRFKALDRNYAYLIDYDNDRHLGGARRPIV